MQNVLGVIGGGWDEPEKNLKISEIKKILEQARSVPKEINELEIKHLVLSGGEPTYSKKRFRRIVEIAKKAGFRDIMLMTNGFYATSLEEAKEWQEDIKQLQVSINRTLTECLEGKKVPHAKRVAYACFAHELKRTKYDPEPQIILSKEGEEDEELIKSVVKSMNDINEAEEVDEDIELFMSPKNKHMIFFHQYLKNLRWWGQALPYVNIIRIQRRDKFAGELSPCRDYLIHNRSTMVYGIEGIHPCCASFYHGVKLMTREEVLESLDRNENVISEAIKIGGRKDWFSRYKKSWKCQDCWDLSKKLHPD